MASGPGLVVRSEQLAPGALRLALVGELDLATAPEVTAQVQASIEGGAQRLVVDLAELTFIDSTGLRLFLVLTEQAQAQGWALTFAHPSEPVRSIFAVTGIERSLPLAEDRESHP